jgi:hypothetical protein
MELRLVPTLREAMASAQQLSAQAGVTEPSSASGAQSRGSEVTPHFLEQLAEAMTVTRKAWTDRSVARHEVSRALLEKLEKMHGRAQLLALEKVALLLHGLVDMVRSVNKGARISKNTDPVVENAVAALSSLRGSVTGEFAFSPDALISALARAQFELASGSAYG